MTIPSNDLSVYKRLMLQSAIKLAKIKPFGLISENTAALVQYLFNRNLEKDSNSYKMIMNIGALSTKISLA